mmetsp:Transcript_48675/g.155528  ORF Transcript_48675/g.155528 Transcript_48675/m.155528 type:complete len:220 (+) Transcript_48675:1052-1711(+)
MVVPHLLVLALLALHHLLSDLLIKVHAELPLQRLHTEFLPQGILFVQVGSIIIQFSPLKGLRGATFDDVHAMERGHAAAPLAGPAVCGDVRHGLSIVARPTALGPALDPSLQSAEVSLRDVSRFGETVHLPPDRGGCHGTLVSRPTRCTVAEAVLEFVCERILQVLAFFEIHQLLPPPIREPGIHRELTLGLGRVESPRCHRHAKACNNNLGWPQGSRP